MLGAQLRGELARPVLNVSAIKELCRKNPIGCIVDNKVRSRVWSVLLLEGQGEGDGLSKGGGGGDSSSSSSSSSSSLGGQKDGDGKKEGGPTMMNAEDARVLDADVKRTRGYLPMFQTPETQDLIRQLLTSYCVNTGMKYKQGMHEILAPFVALSDPPLPLRLIYSMFEAFIHRYLGPFFTDDDFNVVKTGFHLFHLLLYYHDPVLAQHLVDNDFPPSLYATPWIMTLFAHNLEMYLVHRLWDTYLSLDDPGLIYFLALALLQIKRDVLLQADMGELPERIGEIRLSSPDDIAQLLPIALEACRRTPPSFCADLKRTTMVVVTTTPSGGRPPSPPQQQPQDHHHDMHDEATDTSSTTKPEAAAAGSTSSPRRPPFIWHSRFGCKCVEVSSAELVEALVVVTGSGTSSNSMAAGGGGGGEAGGMVSAAGGALGDDQQQLSYVVIDVRSHEEYLSSGGGHITPSLRLEPQVMLDVGALRDWLSKHHLSHHHSKNKGRQQQQQHHQPHICVVGSKIRRSSPHGGGGVDGTGSKGGDHQAAAEGGGMDRLWRRLLLGEGDGNDDGGDGGIGGGGGGADEEADADTAEMLVRILRAEGYAFVSKLRGGFDNLVEYYLYMTANSSKAQPPPSRRHPSSSQQQQALVVVRNHDPVLWEAWRRRQLSVAKLPMELLLSPASPSIKDVNPFPLHYHKNPSGVTSRTTTRRRRPLGPSALLALQASLAVAEKSRHQHVASAIKERIAMHEEALQRQKEQGHEEEDDDDEEEAAILLQQHQTRQHRFGSIGGSGSGGVLFRKAMTMFDQVGHSIIAATGEGGGGSRKSGGGGGGEGSDMLFVDEYWEA